jgi:1-aminocyclopropane-1-carboxylate synthase
MAGLDLTAENFVLSAGLSTILDHLFYLIGDANSTCLVPAPYYPAFDQDLGLKNMVHRQPVRLTSADTDISELDRAYRQGQSSRQPVCALLLTSPDNPTGILYSDERLRAMIKWCVQKRIHCVVDEIYALSVYPENAPMRSALSIAVELSEELDDKGVESLWEHFHVLIAFSKDFCASGAHSGNAPA